MSAKPFEFIQEDIEFLQSLNNSPSPEWNIFVTVEHGYCRNLDHHILQHLENTYKRTINPDFVLCFHCSNEVLSMIVDLKAAYEQYMSRQQAVADAAAMAAMAPQSDPALPPPASAAGAKPPPAPRAPKNAGK